MHFQEEIDFDEALCKAKKYCALQERSSAQVLLKLGHWGVSAAQTGKITRILSDEGYLDDVRFARTYTSNKFRIRKWGRIKISFELRKHRIEDKVIEMVIREIDTEEYNKVLEGLIQKKYKELGNTDNISVRKKVATFAIGKGYESEIVLAIIHKMKKR